LRWPCRSLVNSDPSSLAKAQRTRRWARPIFRRWGGSGRRERRCRLGATTRVRSVRGRRFSAPLNRSGIANGN
jgi:hypothetical protein